MSIIGTWNVTQQSIVGTTDSVWTFTQEGDKVVCDIANNTTMGAVAKDVVVKGNEISLFLTIAKPVQTTANVTLRLDGDTLTGEGKVKFLPAAKISGRRVSSAAAPEAVSTAEAQPTPPVNPYATATPTQPAVPAQPFTTPLPPTTAPTPSVPVTTPPPAYSPPPASTQQPSTEQPSEPQPAESPSISPESPTTPPEPPSEPESPSAPPTTPTPWPGV